MPRTIEGSAADQLVAERMERKAIFEREDPPRTFIVMDEGVIRRTVGGREVMRDQLGHLLEVGRCAKTQLQIVPYGAGYYAGLMGRFTLLGFNDGPDLAYTEGMLLQDRDRVARRLVTWDLIQGHTLPPEASLAMIQEAMEQL